MNTLIHLLNTFGFEEEEVVMYQHLLQNGPATIQQICDQVSKSLLSCQAAIASLTSKGLVSCYENNDGKNYSAEPPRTLLRQLQKKHDQRERSFQKLESMLLELDKNRKSTLSKVRYFEGKEGLITMLEDFLSSKTKDAFEAFPRDKVMKVFSDEERQSRNERRKHNKIFVTGIYTQQEGVNLSNNESRRVVRVDEIEYPLAADIIVYENKIILASLSGELDGVIIESDSVATTLKSIFKLAVRAAEMETGYTDETA